MTFGTPATAVSSAVWAQAIRTLTGLGSNTLQFTGSAHNSLANGTNTSFTMGAGISQQVSIVGEATVNAAYAIGLTDGTTNRPGPSGANSAATFNEGCGNATIAISLANTGTASGFYTFGLYGLKQ